MRCFHKTYTESNKYLFNESSGLWKHQIQHLKSTQKTLGVKCVYLTYTFKCSFEKKISWQIQLFFINSKRWKQRRVICQQPCRIFQQKTLLCRFFMHKKSNFTKALAAVVANTSHIQIKVSQKPGGHVWRPVKIHCPRLNNRQKPLYYYYYYWIKQTFLLFKYLNNSKIFEWLKNNYSTSNYPPPTHTHIHTHTVYSLLFLAVLLF